MCFSLTKHAWKDVVGDVGRDDGDGTTRVLTCFLHVHHTGAAALSALDQAFIGKALQSSTNGLTAAVEGLTEQILGREHGIRGINTGENAAAELIGNGFIFQSHS